MARLGNGAVAGALTFFVIFAIELGRTDISFMGVSDANAVKTIVGRYTTRILGQQVLLLALALTVGALLGAFGDWIVRRPRVGRDDASGRHRFAAGVVSALVGHLYFALHSVLHYPALYNESLYAPGGWRRALLVLATTHISVAALNVVSAIAIVALVGWRLSRTVQPRALAASAGLAIVLVGAVALWLHPSRRPLTTAPNVILIAVDSLRADHVFAPRVERDFPTLAALAKKSIRLEHHFVTVPRTFSSFVTLLTGRYPQHHGIRHMFPRPEQRAAIGRTLPTALREAGYATLAVSDYAGEIFTRTPFGFEQVIAPYFDIRTIVDQRSLQGHPHLLPYATAPLVSSLFPAVVALPERADPELVVDNALAAIDDAPREKPLFATLFFSTTHFPYAAPAPYYARFADPKYDGPFRFSKQPLEAARDERDITQIRALYDGAVAATDAALGRLVKSLDDRGLLANTVIVLCADHGELLYEDPKRGMGHGDHLGGEMANHVPLLIFDGRKQGAIAPRTIDAVTRDIDLVPTLAALVGKPAPNADGVDLSPLLRGDKRDLDLISYSETELWLTETGAAATDERLPYPSVTQVTELLDDGDIVLQKKWEPVVVAAKHRSLRTRDWKVVYRPTPTAPRWALFDLHADPDEQHDVARDNPKLFPFLQGQLAAWMMLDGSTERGGYYLPPEAPLPASATAVAAPSPACRRLLECAGRAEYVGPSIAAALTASDYAQRFVSRWSGLQGDLAARVVAFALTVGDVGRYPEPHEVAASVRYDPVWNRTRAVYESKNSLVAPLDSEYRFPLPDGKSTLSTSVATLPGAPPIELQVLVDERVVAATTIATRDSGVWHGLTTPLPTGKRLTLRARAQKPTRKPTLALWATPELLAAARPDGKNVLVVLIDTLRADALPVMPNLQKLAARGARFSQAVSAATWTRPSLLALYGGELSSRLGHSAESMIPSLEERDDFYRVAPRLLPRAFAERGYRVSAIGNNFFFLGYPQIGLELGFDEVTDIRHPVLDTPAIARAAAAYFDAHQNEPWLLHVHFDAPHWPYTPPSEYRRAVGRPTDFPDDKLSVDYLGEAAYADAHLGAIVAALEKSGQLANTIIVVVGDHGEIFDATHDHVVKTLDLPTLHHHGWSAYDEVVRVPLVVVGAGIPAGTVVDSQVRLTDVAPTVTELAGLPPLAPGRSGKSLVPLATRAEKGDRAAFVEGQNVRLLRQDGWAYLRRTDPRIVVSGVTREVPEELYDLTADPGQHHNLATSDLAHLGTMRADFEAEAPLLQHPPLPITHLRLDADTRPIVVEGTLASDRPLRLGGGQNARTRPIDERHVHVELTAPARLDLIAIPGAALTLDLLRNGSKVAGSDVGVGPYALPYFRGTTLSIAAAQQNWLDSTTAPATAPGQLRLWREPERTPSGFVSDDAAPKSEGEVADIMRKWGYAK